MADGKGGTTKGHWSTALINAVPWKKLRRYELTNIAWSCIALYFTVQFALHQSSQLYPSLLLFVVLGATLGCVLWACKQ